MGFMSLNRRSAAAVRMAGSLLPAIMVLVVILTLGVFFHLRSQELMERKVRDQLQTAAAVGALSLSWKDVETVRKPPDMQKPAYQRMVETLQQIRSRVPDAKYAYILRQSGRPGVLTFVADADSPQGAMESDVNGNGKLDPEEDLSFPGEAYDVSPVPVLQNSAFDSAVTSNLYTDQWGTFLSGFAPIKNDQGTTIAILGIDMDAQQFLLASQSALSPLVLLLVFVVGVLATSYVGVFVWKRRLENMRLLDRERSRLIDLTLHQIGTPLSGFRWWLEIVRDECLKKPNTVITEAFQQLDMGIARMTEIIEALGKASKLRRQEIQLHTEPLNVREAVDATIASFRTDLQYHQQTVDIAVSPEHQVRFDRALLREVLHALIKNAMEYSPYGSRIRVSSQRLPDSVSVSVSDQGMGISAEELESILQNQMRRGSDAMIAQPIGNGLGLYITKGIVERGGGSMDIQSTKGKGTSVTFTLPVPRK